RVAVRRVVAVLLAPARVARGGLDVAVRIGADPDLDPGRRDGERVEALALDRIADRRALRRVVAPAGAAALARDAAHAVGDVAQPGAQRAGAVLALQARAHFAASRAERKSNARRAVSSVTAAS